MDTIVCKYCGGGGDIHHFDMDEQNHYTTSCVVCDGTGQAPSDEFGRTNFKPAILSTIGPRDWATRIGIKMADEWDKR